MKRYDYLEAMKEDIETYLSDSEWKYNFSDYDSIDEFKEEIYNDLWTDDSVTGNASGSYTFNSYEAEENICHNLDLLAEALEEFGCKVDTLEKGAEWCDVTIRCYLLGQALDEVLNDNDIEERIEEAKAEEAEEI